jgi:hypothetical protein
LSKPSQLVCLFWPGVSFGSTLSVHSFSRLGMGASATGQGRSGADMSVLEALALGSSSLVSTFARVGDDLSVSSLSRLRDYLSVQVDASFGNIVSSGRQFPSERFADTCPRALRQNSIPFRSLRSTTSKVSKVQLWGTHTA